MITSAFSPAATKEMTSQLAVDFITILYPLTYTIEALYF